MRSLLLCACLQASVSMAFAHDEAPQILMPQAGASSAAHAADLPALQQARMLIETAASEPGIAALGHAQSLVQAAPYRFAGTPAYDRAVAWALQRLKDSGLRNVRTEALEVPHWVRGCAGRGLPPMPGVVATPHCLEGDAVVRLGGADGERLAATALGGSVGTPRAGLNAPLLMVESLADLDRRPLSAIKDRIVFFNTRMARREDGSGYGEAVTVRTRGAAEAARLGAVGVVIRSIGTNAAERTAHTGGLRYDPVVRAIPAAALAQVDADRLEQQLTQDSSLRLHLRLDSHSQGTTTSHNVIGEIPGSTDEIVLLVAHLDSWDNTPGANDDAAGTGIVIAALELLRAGGTPRRTLRVLLTANEEFGLSGAEAYARVHAAELPRHVLALEADFGSGAVRTLNAGVAANDWPRVQQMAQALKGWGVEPGHNASRGGPDLKPLFERGVPVLAPGQDGSLYFDVHHTPLDGIDRLDAAGIEQAAKVFALLAWTAANAPNTYARPPALR